jgi:glycine cleavage system aminomethyltransferase T
MLGHWIGLGLLARGQERLGERIRAHSPTRGGDVDVEIVPSIFFDPEGARLQS